MKVMCIKDGRDMNFGCEKVECGNEYIVEGECAKLKPDKHHYHLEEYPNPFIIFHVSLFAPLSDVEETIIERKAELV